MASGRMIRRELVTSRKFNIDLKTDLSRVAYCLMLPFTDINGRLDGEPELIKGIVFPIRQDVSFDDVTAALVDLSESGLINWYEVDNRKYIEITRFNDFQTLRRDREAEGLIPPPGPTASDVKPKPVFVDDVEKPEPVKRKPKPKKKQPETPADLPVTASKTPTLYKSIEQAFLSKVGKFTNYEKEGKAIKGLIKKAEDWQPESPAQFIQTIIETYFKMRQDEAFFGKQPFLPSALNSSGIFDRVMVKFEDKSQQIPEELKHLYEGVI